jgi:hypothetical protein
MKPKPLSVSRLIEPSAIFLSIRKSVDDTLPDTTGSGFYSASGDIVMGSDFEKHRG